MQLLCASVSPSRTCTFLTVSTMPRSSRASAAPLPDVRADCPKGLRLKLHKHTHGQSSDDQFGVPAGLSPTSFEKLRSQDPQLSMRLAHRFTTAAERYNTRGGTCYPSTSKHVFDTVSETCYDLGQPQTAAKLHCMSMSTSAYHIPKVLGHDRQLLFVRPHSSHIKTMTIGAFCAPIARAAESAGFISTSSLQHHAHQTD